MKQKRDASRSVRKWIRRMLLVCCALLLLGAGLIALLFFLLNRVPASYPSSASPIPSPSLEDYARFQLDGFESPYLGHTGSWNGKGGTMFGGTKEKEMDREVEMGLRWTFMSVNWRALEPMGPVSLTNGVPDAWKELDEFVKAAHARKLNILFQAPVIGGNAEGPPDWAGRREPGKSAPSNMAAVAEFARKLAKRYKPDGTLAMEQGWGNHFGVRAWEIDNEPEMYRTHWGGQGGDYAEMATKVAAAIKKADPLAIIALPAVASGKNKIAWLEQALNAEALAGSPQYRGNAVPYSIGPIADAVSFHVYEGLDSAFAGTSRTVEVVLDELRGIFDKWESRSAKFPYARKTEYWHTEGNFDFIGALSQERRAAWRIQFFTRAFAAGVRKVCVMDASAPERRAVRAYVQALPWPFPMERAETRLMAANGNPGIVAFRHVDASKPENGQVWILWLEPGRPSRRVKVPVFGKTATIIKTDGSREDRLATNGVVEFELTGDEKMAAPILVVNR